MLKYPPSISDKESRKILKEAAKQGWTFKNKSQSNNSHISCFSPDKKTIVVISSNCRAKKKIINDFKKGGFKTND